MTEDERAVDVRNFFVPEVHSASYGYLADLIRARPSWTRQQLLAATGMSRTTLFDRLDALFQHGYVYQAGSVPSTEGGPGRRSELLRWDDRGRVVLVFDLGQTHARVCITDVHGQILRMRDLTIDIDTDAAEYLAVVFQPAHALLAAGSEERLVGVGLGIPGPVNPVTGVLGRSTTAPRWQSYPLLKAVQEHWHVPVVIENDARAFALGESSAGAAGETVLAVKYATGIGAGIVISGRAFAGSDGAAGDIGHIRLTDGGPRCTCGRRGCLAAWASGHALIRRLADTGVQNLRDITKRVWAEDPAVCSALDEAVTNLGRVLGTVVATINPDVLVLGGVLGRLPRVVEGIDRQIRHDVVDRAAQRLTVTSARLGADGAVVGLARKVVDVVYAPEAIDEVVAEPEALPARVAEASKATSVAEAMR